MRDILFFPAINSEWEFYDELNTKEFGTLKVVKMGTSDYVKKDEKVVICKPEKEEDLLAVPLKVFSNLVYPKIKEA